LYLSNHDQPRPVSRFGDDRPEHRVTSAKLLGTWLHGLQGTPYVYQGEELGMGNVAFPSIDDYQDIESRNYWRTAVAERGEDPATVLNSIHAKGRDNARTPMPWSVSQPHAGFSTGTPWLQLNPSWREVNAAQAVADPDSVFHHYRRLIALRQQHPVMAEGRTMLLLPDHPQVCAVLRTLGATTWLVVCNFSGSHQAVALHKETDAVAGTLLLGNLPERPGTAEERATVAASRVSLQRLELAPWEALILALDRDT
ncbi:MAG: DUF3459 domain-containing protein, partial [Arenimonas sp.]|nr:DUF3459 domain-containing protein [Arenimonas sp.]